MKSIRIFYHFLRLVRWLNLMIVIATMFLMRYAIISPLLKVNDLKLQLSTTHFILLVFATTIITAAGYIINDYFDRKTDLINKPYKVIVGRFIKRRAAMFWHTVFNAAGVLTGVYISYKNNMTSLSLIYILSSGILWFYSTNYKKQPFLGNIVVAALTAMVPLMVIIYEFPLINKAYAGILVANNESLSYIKFWIIAFAYFAFITTLIREIVKDIEDLEGDSAYGKSSVPLVLGVKWAKIILTGLYIILLVSVGFVLFRYVFDIISILYLSFIILIPVMILIYLTLKAGTKNDYSRISNILKIIIAGGILYSVIARYIILTQI